MPNPFKRRGSSFQPGDWKAWNIGLLALLAEEPEDQPATSFAFIGDIGSGKTTALDAYRERVQAKRPEDIFLMLDVGKYDVAKAMDLRRQVYLALVDALGEDVHDQVTRELRMDARVINPYLGSPEMYAMIGGMIRNTERAKRRAHVLVDECQRPAEAFEGAKDTERLRDWFELLKNLAEVVTGGGGCIVITTTTAPWERGPQHARDRFVALGAGPPAVEHIQLFIEQGLLHVGNDDPASADAALASAIKEAYPEVITVRELHDLCFRMWRKANRAGATVLSATHLP